MGRWTECGLGLVGGGGCSLWLVGRVQYVDASLSWESRGNIV